ncbi:MAG: hypothetical protein Q8904_06405 [Bacteroidota bacterium]|nr:hypothetical protein [Bacteroidota bacterium]
METENLKEKVINLLIAKIEGLPQTAYQLNLVTRINLSTCRQVLNGTWNPTWNTLIDMEAKYSK